jgi:hypothetical protein
MYQTISDINNTINLQQYIDNRQNESFNTSFPDLFQKYQNPPLHTNGPWNTWLHSSFNWWQCQLNFAVWCASTGCGVSYNDHLIIKDSLTSSVYMFHQVFQGPLVCNGGF